ncbi:hypothetical protein [Actinokineospora sp. NBRC 105648]|uniref:hypothetical protein n=1 Tax=Actinokineospora sp. NBRC 105648 TaxID=3032206 RepID=UPI0024A56564|nr:hypothetical protein [Actinokineospora sp. NBRC 105648]GLZ37050.1 hypothetical protein Acsp05_06750 [Actinokineospora sp. NBRC 105648]
MNRVSLNGVDAHLRAGVVSDVLDGTVRTTRTSGPLTGTNSHTVGAANPNLDCALRGLSSLSVPIGQTTFL